MLKQKDENASIFRRGKNNRLAEYFLKSATSQHLRDANGNRTGDLTDMRRTLYEHGYGGQMKAMRKLSYSHHVIGKQKVSENYNF